MFINFVWHFHQPIYRHPDSGEYLLPWVNYHTTKNYWQMLKIIKEMEFPCTINLVPSLLQQMNDYAEGKALDKIQLALEKPAEKLNSEELTILKRFFPKFSKEDSPQKLQQIILAQFFSPLDQPEIKSQSELLALRKKIFSTIFGYFRQLKIDQLLELTVSPYYHPLLPLIIDLGQAKDEAPDLPEFQYPQDAQWQLKQAREYFKKIFNFYPPGLWPSEGACSQAACELIAKSGFSFTFTDEHLLWKSLDQRPDFKLLYRPYKCAGVNIFFRDRELSDLIGFEYHRWPAEQAVTDFLRKLEIRAEKVSEEAICSIILDGENPWGAYPQNGIDFLRLLLEKIKENKHFQPVLPSAYLKNYQAEESVKLVAGTWMSGFFKWVGHPEKVAAWKRLSEVRKNSSFSNFLAVAEGSDWFWWAGETEEKEFNVLFWAYLEKAQKLENNYEKT